MSQITIDKLNGPLEATLAEAKRQLAFQRKALKEARVRIPDLEELVSEIEEQIELGGAA